MGRTERVGRGVARRREEIVVRRSPEPVRKIYQFEK